MRFSPAPRSDLIASGILAKRHSKYAIENPTGRDEVRNKDDGAQGEIQYLWESSDAVKVIAGSGVYDTDRRNRGITTFVSDDTIFTPVDETKYSHVRHRTGYAYTYLQVLDDLLWTMGVSHDDYFQQGHDVNKTNPKLGIQWNICGNVQLRAAAFRAVKPPFIADRTIQPTQVSGFNQFFDDANGTEAWRYGVGLDAHVAENLDAGLEFSKRSLSEPVTEGGSIARADRDEYLYMAYLYWTPAPRWALSGEAQFDYYKRELQRNLSLPEKVETLSFPLSVAYFDPMGFFGAVVGTFEHQDVVARGSPATPDGNDSFFVVDASVGFRLPERRGLISLQARNLFDTRTKYQDDSFREFRDAFSQPSEPVPSLFIPERAFLFTITLNL